MIVVRWEDTAINQAAALWLAGDSLLRQSITSAMNRIDDRLEKNAAQEGESRPKNRRILFEFPLGCAVSHRTVGRRLKRPARLALSQAPENALSLRC
jgi:hypothetical protein